ncbi:hypothetical protein ACQ4PT_044863 [Festuca glaucescens]
MAKVPVSVQGFDEVVRGRVAGGMDEVQYKFNVKKRNTKTRICGSGYEKFISDYDLKVGDRIRVELDNAPEYFVIVPEGADGVEKHRVEEVATTVVYTKDINLTSVQTTRKKQHLGQRGIGMGAVFVHTLTGTDTKANGMRIPKEIVKALNITKKGWVILSMGKYNNKQEASYYTSTDGRIRFESGWAEFVEEFNLKTGNIVLILFHMEGCGFVEVSIHLL